MDTSLHQYPVCSDHYLADGTCEYTLPDLHGNALKLLNALIKIGMINMPKHKYKKFLDCYFTDSLKVKKETLSILRNAIASIKLVKKTGKLRFIGDELCDRGSNDYYTLLVFKKLSEMGVHCEFVMSNHGFEFIQGHERGKYTPMNIPSCYAKSMLALSNFFSKKLVKQKEVKTMVDKYYKPKLKVLSHTSSKDQITIYTHAPAGLQQIKKLSLDFNVEYKDDTVQDLSRTIDKINDIFHKKYVKRNLIHTIKDKLYDITWNRNYKSLERPETYKGYKINFVHGHDAGEETSKNIYNLDFDNDLGKGCKNKSGKIRFLSESQR